MTEIDKDMRELDRLKSERLTKKNDVDAMEEHIGKVLEVMFLLVVIKKIIWFKDISDIEKVFQCLFLVFHLYDLGTW